jgi:Cys-tRNA(Pro)/Cys-tRNA(Cys) deacylase
MDNFEGKLKKFLIDGKITGEHLHFVNSVHTVEDACREVNAEEDDFVKTICMISQEGNTICAIVLGSCRASTERVAKALNIARPHVASPQEALERTGYLVGGTPPFGYKAIFLIDPEVMAKEAVYAGGGTPNALIKISTKELQKANDALIVRIRK